jgi:hypothetical protein
MIDPEQGLPDTSEHTTDHQGISDGIGTHGEASFAKGVAEGNFTFPLQETTAINFVNEISQIVGGNSVFLESPSKVPTPISKTLQNDPQEATDSKPRATDDDKNAVPSNKPSQHVETVTSDDTSFGEDQDDRSDDQNGGPGDKDDDPTPKVLQELYENKICPPITTFALWCKGMKERVEDPNGHWFNLASTQVLVRFERLFQDDWNSFHSYCEVADLKEETLSLMRIVRDCIINQEQLRLLKESE